MGDRPINYLKEEERMRTGNRIWALILALAMVLSMGVTAFAQDGGDAPVIESYTFVSDGIAGAGRSAGAGSFGSQLSGAAKNLYNAIEEFISDTMTDNVIIVQPAGVTQDNANAAFSSALPAILSDYPEKLYWANATESGGGAEMFAYFDNVTTVVIKFDVITDYRGATFTYAETGVDVFDQMANEGKIAVRKLNLSGSSATMAQAEAIAKNEILSTISSSDKPYDKIVKFNDWLTANVRYDEAALNSGAYTESHQMTGALVNNKAVCEGYAKAFKYLCDQSGIDCVLVSGTATNPGGKPENHMWNAVSLGGKWYMVDTTWNNATNDKYLCIGSTEANKDHTATSISVELSATDYDPNSATTDPEPTPPNPDDTKTYTISVGTTTGVTITPNKTTAKAGEAITLAVRIAEGYEAPAAIQVNGATITGNTFTMPAENVVITGSAPAVSAPTYAVNIGELTGITVTADKTSARAGERVALSVKVLEGYEAPVTLFINGRELAKDATAFAMPAADVTITGSAAVAANLTVAIEPDFLKLTVGSSSLLTAKVTMKDGSDYTGNYNWKFDGSIIGLTEANEGSREQMIVTGKANGLANITLTVTGNRAVTASARVFVGNVTPDPDEPGTSIGGGSGGGSSSSEHGWWDERDNVERKSSSSTSNRKTDEKSVVALTNAALKSAAAGQTPVVRLQNAVSILRSTLKAALNAAGNKGVIFHFDTVKKGAVESRLYLRPSLLQGKDADSLRLGVTINPANLRKTFDQYYKNKFHLVSFSQKGGFGGAIEVAVKVELSGFNTNALSFYHYDSASNIFYKLTNVKYFIDANGYLHIQNLTNLDTVIVSDGSMVRK